MDKPRLHDASILRIVLIWEDEAEARLVFRVDGPRLVVLKALGVANLSCPHENPWGPSISVNEFRGPYLLRENVERIEVEVQSGDTIIVDARAWEWVEAETRVMSEVDDTDRP